ncbi:unnamed protein product [Didymodactylos carnosus]|uniref:E2 NEDD8-conjugating enzyme n=1 Tax=Didymodactylos carnosus TaxID=1234261 RepID=A0A813SMZ7_9BILA|nr:unnamed protein product [Didymodactylos carnosus]CAF3584149.1 unnamed protein product [Didymodactylos carnosus]
MIGLPDLFPKAPPRKTTNGVNPRSGLSIIRDTLLAKEHNDWGHCLPVTCKTIFENIDKLEKFDLIITPGSESMWHRGRFVFTVEVPITYNMMPPKVTCRTKIWHPNINEDGQICLSILREASVDGKVGWLPTRTLKDVIFGLDQLFTDLVDFDDALNMEAANQYKQNPEVFKQKVASYIDKYCQIEPIKVKSKR